MMYGISHQAGDTPAFTARENTGYPAHVPNLARDSGPAVVEVRGRAST
jgi:hypothetical protein